MNLLFKLLFLKSFKMALRLLGVQRRAGGLGWSYDLFRLLKRGKEAMGFTRDRSFFRFF